MKQVENKMRARYAFKRSLIDLEVEDEGRIETVSLEEGQICWKGFRKLRGKLVRGVPKRNKNDCLKYCCHEGCDLI